MIEGYPEGVREIALEEEKEKLLSEIMKIGSISGGDNLEFRGAGRGVKDLRRKRVEGGMVMDNPFPKDLDDQWRQGEKWKEVHEAVALSSIIREKYKKVPVMRKKKAKGIMGLFGKKVDVVDRYSYEVIGQAERKFNEEVESDLEELAYSLRYNFYAPSLETLDTFYKTGLRPRQVDIRFGICLPKSLAEKTYRIIKESPDFVRKIILSMLADESNQKSTSGLWDDKAWKAWLENKGRTKMYVNPEEGVDNEYNPEHVVDID